MTIVLLVIGLLAGLLLGALIVHLTGTSMQVKSTKLQLTAGFLIAQIITYVPLMAVAIASLPYAARRTLAELGLHPPLFRDLGAGALGAVVMFAVAEGSALLQNALFHIDGKEQAVALFGTTHDETLIVGLVILTVFIAPFAEEIVFRGFLFNALLRYLPLGAAVIVSGLIFGAAHGDKVAFFPLACSGMVLALVYARTGSLVASMFTHGIFNFANVVLVLATGKG